MESGPDHPAADGDVPTFCRVCEPACGLVATVSDGTLVSVRPDRAHPVTRGFACPKGIGGLDVHRDPDRLDHPLRRHGSGWHRQSWDEALVGVAADLRRVLDEHGSQALAVYWGNPTSFNSLLSPVANAVLAQLGVFRTFSSATQDCANKYAASEAVYGSSTIHPIPDVDNTDALMVIGANPRVSKGSFWSIAHPHGAILAAARRGARIWFVDPRRTESAELGTEPGMGEVVQLRPGTDPWFLAALLHEIDASVGFHPDAAAHGRHVAELRAFVADHPPEAVAEVVGVPADRLRAIAREFASARSASVHVSTGLNMGRHGTVAYWLAQMLCLVTGNLDRRGGNVLSRGFYRSARAGRADFGQRSSESEFGPVRDGHLPGTLLADHVLDAQAPVRALVVVAGNPLRSIGGEERLRAALSGLDVLVCIDVYRNVTGDLAHWLLPAADMFERADVNLTGLGLQAEPWVQWTPAVVEPLHERREEWWIFAALARELGLSGPLDAADPVAAVWARIDHMLGDRGLDLAAVRSEPRGIAFPDGLQPGRFFSEDVQTPDGLVDCFPEGLVPGVRSLAVDLEDRRREDPHQLRLISRRDSRTHNTWYANVVGPRAGDDRHRVQVNPADAERLGLVDGETVEVRSEWGHVLVPCRHDPDLRPGVVCLEQGRGPQPGMSGSQRRDGVNVNRLLPSGPGSYDPLSNQAWMTGIPVTVHPSAG